MVQVQVNRGLYRKSEPYLLRIFTKYIANQTETDVAEPQTEL